MLRVMPSSLPAANPTALWTDKGSQPKLVKIH